MFLKYVVNIVKQWKHVYENKTITLLRNIFLVSEIYSNMISQYNQFERAKYSFLLESSAQTKTL